MEIIPISVNTPEITKAIFLTPTKSKLKCLNKFLETPVMYSMFLPRPIHQSDNQRVINTPLNKFIIKPTIKVVANPFTGPKPK